MLFAVVLFVAPDVAAASAAARTAINPRATMLRLFIWIPPESSGPVALLALSSWGCEGSRRRAVGIDQLSLRGIVSHVRPICQYQL